MSFRERSAWISLITTLMVWGRFFMVLFEEIGTRHPSGGRLMATFIGCVIFMVVIQIIIATTLAILHPNEYDSPADEREKLIELKASRIAYVSLSLLVMGVVIGIPALGGLAPHLFPNDPVGGALTVIGGAVFLAFMLAELIHAAGQIFYFRRSA